MSEAKKRRGRPREYDQAKVLEAVLDVFWRKGFSGATLPELAAAAGITRPSLYTALGDKLSMYLRSLEHFEHGLRAQLAASFPASRSLADGLLDFYTAGIDLYAESGDRPLGCLVVCTAAAEAHEEPEIEAALAKVLRVLDEAFEERFRIAAEARCTSSGIDVLPLAHMASATLHSLAIRARAGQNRAHLLAFAQSAARLLAAAVAGHPEVGQCRQARALTVQVRSEPKASSQA